MYVVTGGFGFIGSNLVASIKENFSCPVVICDWLGNDDKWKNLVKHDFEAIISPSTLIDYLDKNAKSIKGIFHMGAMSSTTETDADKVIDLNYRYSINLFRWCADNNAPFIYASSAATYGNGEVGFKDDESYEELAKLQPLNIYGWSKHLFDQYINKIRNRGVKLPPQYVGLKFFNVYGPNEYHKGAQQSVISHFYKSLKNEREIRLFKSNDPSIQHGEQKRDFIWVQDCVDVMIWLISNPHVSGLFNVGTGIARTFLDIAQIMCDVLKEDQSVIKFIDFPTQLNNKYQNFTQANMQKLKSAGYTKPFTSLEKGVRLYLENYLMKSDQYR